MSIVQKTRDDLDLSAVDWSALKKVSDARIEAQALAADDCPPFTDDEIARATWVRPVVADDVKAIRGRLGLSQEQFAARFGFSVETLRNYEQGHRRPTGPASVLLRVIASEPDAVTRALAR
jgi:putative transcriptional regulator